MQSGEFSTEQLRQALAKLLNLDKKSPDQLAAMARANDAFMEQHLTHVVKLNNEQGKNMMLVVSELIPTLGQSYAQISRAIIDDVRNGLLVLDDGPIIVPVMEPYKPLSEKIRARRPRIDAQGGF